MSIGGIFINSRTGAQSEVELRSVNAGMEIRDPRDNLMLALWAYADMAPVRPLKAGQRLKKLRILCHKDPESRLVVVDPALISLLQKANYALRPPRKPLPRWVWGVAAGIGTLFLAWLVLQGLVTAAGPLARSLPTAWETAMSQRLADHLIRHLGGACNGPGGQAALDALGQRFDHDATRTTPVRLRTIKSLEINSFALPSSLVIVTAGMLHDIETPDQFAGMLAHQLAHLDLHHTTKQVIGHTGFALITLATLGEFPPITDVPLKDLQHLAYNHAEENEANVLAQTLLKKADISAQSLGSYFRLQELREKTRDFPSDFQTAHPALGKRQETQGVQPFSRPALSDQEWQSLRRMCD